MSRDKKPDPSIYETLVTMGNSKFLMEKFDVAKTYYVKSLKNYEQLSSLEWIDFEQTVVNLSERISFCCVRTSEFEDALIYFHKALQTVVKPNRKVLDTAAGSKFKSLIFSCLLNLAQEKMNACERATAQNFFCELEITPHANNTTEYTVSKVDEFTKQKIPVIQRVLNDC